MSRPITDDEKAESTTERNCMSAINQEQTDTQLEEIENQYWIDQNESLAILENDKHFQRVILDGYFKERALDSVSLLGTDYIKQAGKRPEVMEVLVAISILQDHFATIRNLGAILEDEQRDAETEV